MLRTVVGLVLAVVALLLVAWVALPMWIERAGVRIASEQLGRTVTLGHAHFTPWRLVLELEDLKIAGPAAASPPLVEVKRFRTVVSPRSIWHLAPVLSSVKVESPRVRVALLPEGKTDLDDILARLAAAPTAPPKPDEGPAEAAVYNIELTDGEFRLDDRAAGMVHELKALHLGVPLLSTLDADVEVNVLPRLSGQLNGVGFQSEGQAQPFAQTRAASMTVKLDALDLSAYRAYWPKTLPLRLAKGFVDTQLTLDFKQPPKQTPEVKISGRTAVREVSLQRREGAAGADAGWADWLRWQALTVDLADVQPLKRQVLLGAVTLKHPELRMGRDAQGRLWLPEFATAGAPASQRPAAMPVAATAPASGASGASSAAPAAKPAGPAPWRIGVQQLALDGGRVGWTDEALRPAAQWRVDALTVKGSGLSWPLAAKAAPIELAATLAPEGAKSSASLTGKGALGAAGIALDWTLKDLGLDGIAPYLKAATPLSVQGSFATQGSVRAGPNGENLKLALKALSLDALQVTDGKKPVLALKQLTLDQAEVALDTRKLTAGRLALVAPKAQLGRDKSGKWSWDAWMAPSAMAAGSGGQGAAAPAHRRVAATRGDRLTLDAPERPQSPPTPAASTAAGDGAPWSAQIAEIAIEGGEATLLDLATHVLDDEPARPIGAQELALKLTGIDWDGRQLRKPLPVVLSATLRRPDATRRGAREVPKFRYEGQVALAPLKASGRVTAEHLPLHWADPYLDPSIGIHLQRAEGSVRGGFEFTESPKGPSVKAGGEVLIAELRLRQARLQDGRRRSAEDLLSWQGLKLGGLRVALAPGGAPDVKIQQAVLDEFYARLIVSEQGRLNLRDLNQTEQGQAVAAVAAVAGTPAASAPVATTVAKATAAPTPGASAAASSAAASPPPLRLSIAETRLNGGKVDFNDRFIKPNYSANLSELTGTLGAFSAGSAEMAPLQLKGKVEGTGLLDISGKLNPSGAPLALDITASATDIELAPLSPYAGKYAGYAIERGKLSTRVHYEIEPGGRLQADNKIVLNQLTFGDRIDSPTATKLPVKLAVALLKDRDGVIDVNLPVSGSLNDPEFSVGGLVIKLIVNLLTKALTAPFSLLSGGGGAEMSQLEFKPGTAALQAEAAKKLEPLTKVLADKPQLQLSITGWVDPAGERRAAQAARLEDAMIAERRRELRRASVTQNVATAAPGAAASAASAASAGSATAGSATAGGLPPVVLDNAQRARLLKAVYDNAKLPNKPRNFIGLAKDLPPEQMRELLMDSYTVTDEQLRELALQRAVAVRDALIERGVPNARMFLASPKLHESGDERGADKDKPWQPRVDLALSAQ